MELIVKGLIGGFIIAVPLGPVSVLCFRRVLTERRWIGLATVFGAASADTIYGLIAALGITAITRAIQRHLEGLHFFGGLILLGLGVAMIRSNPKSNGGDAGSGRSGASAFLSAFLLMIANPVVVISFLGVFAVLEIDVHPTGLLGAAQVGAGLFAGSSAWWVVYSLADWIAGAQLRQCGLRAINLGGGLLICGFGLWHLGVAFIHRH